MFRLRPNRELSFWSEQHNSYVCTCDGDIQTYRIHSINGLGEIRWTIDPTEPYTYLGDPGGKAAIDYFLES